MRILITGAAGFIGSHLVDSLLLGGHQVFGFDNFSTGSQNNLTRFVCGRGDVADRDVFYEFANYSRPDLIIHCAASYADPDKWHRDLNTNAIGTVNAVLAAKHHDARLFYFQTALPPVSSYAISKHAGNQYIKLSGVPYVTFRLANIYGPRNLSGAVPTFYKRLAAGQPCTVVDTRRDMVYISDLVDLVLRAVTKPDAVGEFDVCDDMPYEILSIYNAVAHELGVETEPELAKRGPDDVEEMFFDAAPTFSEFGWQNRVLLADGVRHAVAWYREHGVEQTYTHLRIQEEAKT